MPCLASGLVVDNIKLSGNTISTLNTNGNITFDLNGSGALIFNDLTATTVPYLDASKKLASSSATPTQLGFLANATSNLCGISQSCTLTNKTLTSPAITTPTGIVKGDVGLGNVDNTSDSTKNSASATLTNKTISGASNTITNVSLSSGVTGTLPIANGGTGQTTANAALNALLPSQTSNGGKYLQTDGTNTAWAGVTATVTYSPPSIQRFTSSTSTYYLHYTFVISSGSATAGATYTNNGITYTVHQTVSSATQVVMYGSGAPTSSGTLTKASGTGDSTLTFSQSKTPLYLEVEMIGAGGGGGGSGTTSSGGTGGTGGSTTFGSSLLTAAGGVGGTSGGSGTTGGAGGAATVNSPAITLVSMTGSQGQGYFNYNTTSTYTNGGMGGPTPFGGNVQGGGAQANSGTGGAGGGTSGTLALVGTGGGAGAYIKALIPSPSASYATAVGAAGTAGAAGTSGNAGGAGGSGVIVVKAHYQ